MSAEPTVAECLRAAADLMAQRGWVRNTFVNSKGAVCLIGAIRSVVFTGPNRCDRWPLYDRCYHALEAYTAPYTPVQWNDFGWREFGEAEALLRQVAAEINE